MGKLLLLSFILTQWSVITFGQENITFKIVNVTGIKVNKTAMLRYGHQRVSECQEFEKAYFCIMICIRKGYDIAYSDKTCECICYRDKVKAKYLDPRPRWIMPTTSKPAWAGHGNGKGKIIGGEYVYSSIEVEDHTKINAPGNSNFEETKTIVTEATEMGVQDTTLNNENNGGNEEDVSGAGEEAPSAGEEEVHEEAADADAGDEK